MNRTSRQGFTLIELLVVIAILSVVTTVGTVTLVNLWARWGELKTVIAMDAAAEDIFDEMRSDFSSAVASTIAGTALQATGGEEQDPKFYGHPLESDRFTIPVEVPTPNGKSTILAGYQIERKDGQSLLVRTEQQLRAGVQPRTRTVAEGVAKMRVEYAGSEGGWKDSWAGPGNPRAVRVSVLLVEPGNPQRQQVARKAVFTVNVP
ncbi:MAG: prepilin-type N-terminal cleavage/methylation domain-containing protein [Candidatus Hydrogenedentes bacterium]|nr:prepilin-type N-terminal cleavage/methylation domain-containing protein [Candidatus Hydrogenedentota bacterium]